ncbi:uncharacterized protein LOC124657879 isoform X2 [Lolium rigidum]|uniref:uncharacterized protein LOC124657879 isoform X2 n=1 Tax=Lolium rigidum TaxID=89674 RepID=UPI001F5C711A|nr:uncharacterized protein LOC124657879 isoform X2 [Lolium rigidum]
MQCLAILELVASCGHPCHEGLSDVVCSLPSQSVEHVKDMSKYCGAKSWYASLEAVPSRLCFCDPVLTADSERERAAIYLMQSVERESNAMANTKGAAFEEKGATTAKIGSNTTPPALLHD